MRHQKLNKRFGRNRSARKALIRDLAKAALYYESITTTKVKAKEARKLVERLISWGKEGSLHSKRLANRELCDHNLVSLLFKDIAKRFQERNGGYTRIYSLLNRRGDGTGEVVLELTEKKIKAKPQRIKTKETEELKEKKETEIKEDKKNKESEKIKGKEKEAVSLERAKIDEKQKPQEAVKIEKPQEEKSAPPLKEKHKYKETKPPAKFLGGLRKFFKKERDSL